MKRTLITKERLLAPIKATCGKCGGEATIYAYPIPTGTCFCPACSPSWLGSFLDFATKQEVNTL